MEHAAWEYCKFFQCCCGFACAANVGNADGPRSMTSVSCTAALGHLRRRTFSESRRPSIVSSRKIPRPVIPGGAVCCQSPLRRVLGRDQMRLKVSSPPSITVSSKRLA